ncbi:hypothetical protein BEWA_042310 [Theileria equi strain WA]|uniref:Uncharacterized protein n=1 Tax=Theileria equi strain WA TaxID=1537102 RepID=L1LGB5_THEEQ|nr:hypothetical protein BEWA_042310 [Theileria equi strain WA]EKX74193.1 hypothetical protein BEWA_042310 [Theileria equi strain WA]|eukprot:XP_004833645.1 hypothetical protein BEWA_042310 [Theileria equi strain WA]
MDNLDEPSDCRASTDQAVEKYTQLSRKIVSLKKKWELCIFQVTLENEPENISIKKQLSRFNRLIRSTMQYLKPKDCKFQLMPSIKPLGTTLFHQLCSEFRENDKFVKCVYTLTIRWWFCWRFSLHLSLFPYLGTLKIIDTLTMQDMFRCCIIFCLEFIQSLKQLLSILLCYWRHMMN